MHAMRRSSVPHWLTRTPIALAWLVWAVGYLGRSLTLKRPEAGALAGLLLLLWLPALAASALFFNRALRASPGQRRPALALGIAFALWTAAEILWSLSLLFPAAAGLASLADWLHLAGYPMALAGLWLHPAPPREGLQRLRFELDVAIYGGSWGLLLWAILIFPMLQQVVRDPHDLFWAASFPTLDLVLLVLLIWWQRQTPRPLPSLWLVAGGIFFSAALNLTRGWLGLQDMRQIGTPLDVMWIIAFGLLAMAAVTRDPVWPAAPPSEALTPRRRWQRRWQRAESRLLPLATAMSLIVYVLVEWQGYGRVDPIALWGSLTILILVILRQGVSAGQAELRGYATLVQHIADPAFICDETGRVFLANPALGRALGGAVPGALAEVIQRPGALTEAATLRAPLPPVLLQSALERGWEGEVWVRPAGIGEAAGFPAWLTLRPLPHGEGEARRLAGLLHDLTPQRLHERELREAYEQAEAARQALVALSSTLEQRVREKTTDLSHALTQLEEQNRALRSLDQLKSEFVALTSHELRTPLSSIRAGLELMLSDPTPVPDTARTMLDLVHRETQRLGRFVESILNLSALEAGRFPLQLAPTNLAQCVEGVRASLAASHGGSASPALERLELSLPPDLPDVWADDQMLGSVLFHLVDNAIKYAPQAPIRLTARAQDQRVDIIVADRGPGVPPEAEGRLWQMFSRLESADAPRVAGYGLGLYVSRRFVEAMGGEIAVDSAPGQGMTVRVRLPVARESE